MSEKNMHEITTDGRVVWINGPANCLGRFGLQGIDIYLPLGQQTPDNAHFFSTQGPTSAAEWSLFVEKMREHHGIDVPAHYRPARCGLPN